MTQNSLLKPQIGSPKDSRPITNQPSAGRLSRKQFERQNWPPEPTSQQRIRDLLSRKQVAEILGTCIHTVARNKELKPIRFNARLVRYRAEDVERYIEAAG